MVNHEGQIIIHPNLDLMLKPLEEIIDSELILQQPSGSIETLTDGHRRLAYFSTIEETGWKVVTVVDAEEVMAPIVAKIAPNMLILLLVSVLCGLMQSRQLTARLSKPMEKLLSKVSAIVNREDNDAKNYQFPENEIGAIARQVASLAEDELYTKSEQLNEAYEEINNQNQLLERQNVVLKEMAVTDNLTKVFNRHKMEQVLKSEIKRAKRYHRPLSLLMLDIDHFKKINDKFGHPKGDEVLQELCRVVESNIRSSDTLARWGGEEFLIACPESSLDDSYGVASKLVDVLRNHDFGLPYPVTISIGVATLADDERADDILIRVDQNLYQAKNLGRDRVEVGGVR